MHSGWPFESFIAKRTTDLNPLSASSRGDSATHTEASANDNSANLYSLILLPILTLNIRGLSGNKKQKTYKHTDSRYKLLAMENDDLQKMDHNKLQTERLRLIEIIESKRAAMIEHLPLGRPGVATFSAAEGLHSKQEEFDSTKARIEARIAVIDKLLKER